jgi:hypothetical protein
MDENRAAAMPKAPSGVMATPEEGMPRLIGQGGRLASLQHRRPSVRRPSRVWVVRRRGSGEAAWAPGRPVSSEGWSRQATDRLAEGSAIDSETAT